MACSAVSAPSEMKLIVKLQRWPGLEPKPWLGWPLRWSPNQSWIWWVAKLLLRLATCCWLWDLVLQGQILWLCAIAQDSAFVFCSPFWREWKWQACLPWLQKSSTSTPCLYQFWRERCCSRLYSLASWCIAMGAFESGDAHSSVQTACNVWWG